MRFRAVNFYYLDSEALDFFFAILCLLVSTISLSLNLFFKLPNLISAQFISLPPIISCIDLIHSTIFLDGQTNATH